MDRKGRRSVGFVILPALRRLLTERGFRVAVISIAGLGILALTSCSSPQPTASSPPRLDDVKTATDGGQIRVVESGFQLTPLVPGLGETNRALVGVVLENTSKHQQSQATELTIRLFDAAGRSLFDTGGSPGKSPTISAPVIRPGGRIGVGRVLMTDEAAARNLTPVRMDVQVGGSDWRQPNDKPEININDVKVTEHADGTADIAYTAQAPDLKSWADLQVPSANVLFRDSSGKLLAGNAFNHNGVPSWSAGTTQRQIHFTADQWKYAVPSGADLSRTEVYGSIDGG